jgi:hypothetical protein
LYIRLSFGSRLAQELPRSFFAPAFMKRQLLEDAGDRAQKLIKSGEVRIPLAQIGFWPKNRGGVGANGYHVHEVAHDVLTNKTKLQRYGHCNIILIPEEMLQKMRDANRLRCSCDPLMPKFSKEMKFVAMSKTHFLHAHKLAQDGGRTLFNKQDGVPIVWKTDDYEGALILEHGIKCQIYDSSLLYDTDAASALASEDNLNATVQWGEDEMQAFGRASEMVDRLSSGDGTTTIGLCIASLQIIGLGQFTVDDWKDFLTLRMALPTAHSQVLQNCQFNACAGRVRVKPCDFGLSAKLDPRAPWAKVALILFQYISSLQDATGGVSAHTFTGRQEIVVRKMQPDVVKELVTEADFVMSVDAFIQQMCVAYGKPTQGSANQMNDLLVCRGNLLSLCGRYLLRVGGLLEQAAKKAAAHHTTVKPEERINILDTDSPGKLNKIEALFRTDLVKQNLYTEDTLPPAIYPDVVCAPPDATYPHGKPKSLASQCVTNAPVGTSCAPAGPLVLADGQALTEAHVLNRLGVKAYGDEVFVLWIDAPERATGVKAEPVDTISGVAEALDGSQSSQGTWCKVELMSLCLPDAVVALVTKVPQPDSDGSQQPDSESRVTRTVPADGLRPVPVIKEPRQTVILHPSLRDPGTTLGPYSFDDAAPFCEKAVAAHMILWAHACGIKSVEGVTVSIISDPGKLPLILQVRANVAFKKGALLLAPAHGELLCKDSDAGREFVQGYGPNQTQVVHPAMLSHVELDVMTGSNDLRVRGGQDGTKSKWFLFSPLLAGKNKNTHKDCLGNVAPFWSLLRCSSPAVPHNMELESMYFKDGGFDSRVPAFPKLQKGSVFTVQLPIARNISHISKGEILCLPFA